VSKSRNALVSRRGGELPEYLLHFPFVEDAADRTIRLRDGRLLGYAEWGDPPGRPLFYFHGWPGSRVEGRLGDEASKAKGIRKIALDRPGMGCGLSAEPRSLGLA
jgi:hypothetical protein